MADAFRGLTIRLGADARPLNSALSSIRSSASQAQKQLNAMNKALKFDGSNVGAMAARIDLAGDKAMSMARAAVQIRTAMNQAGKEVLEFSERSGAAGGKLKAVANSTRDAHAQAQRLRSEYNHVDTELQHIYDHVERVAKEKLNFKSLEEARAHVQKLRREMSGTGDSARAARAEMEKLVRATAMRTDVGKAFGLGSTLADASKLWGVLTRLRSEQVALNNDLTNMNKVVAYRNARVELISMKSALKQAAAEAARFKAEMYSTGSAKGLASALSYTQRLDSAVEEAYAHAQKMREAYQAMPRSLAAYKASLGTAKQAQEALSAKAESLRNVLKTIESNQAFDKQAASAKNAYVAYEKAENAVAEIGAEAKTAEARFEALNAEMKEAKSTTFVGPHRSLDVINADLEEAKANLAGVKARAIAADEALEKAALSRRWRETNAQLAEAETRMAALSAQTSKLNAFRAAMSGMREFGYGLYSTVTPALMIAGRYAIQAANDIDSAYRDMRKTVNGTEEEFEHLKDAALEFSQTHVTSADTILEIEALGGQLGIQARNLESFAETISNLDIATDIDSEDLATYAGQLSNIMRDIDQSNPEQYAKDLTSFSDALVRLGNNSAAQESSIMKVMMRIASIGNISGMTTPQLLAISTAVAATGQGCEAAGTAISKTFSNIEAAVGAGGDKLQGFADVAGMSAERFADAWNNDPVTAFTAFIEGLKRIDEAGGSVDNTLTGLKITSVRQKQALMGLTNTLDVLHDSLGMSQDAWDGLATVMSDGSIEQAGDAAREAQRKSEGFSGELSMMKNNAMMLAEELAGGAVPIIKDLGDKFEWLTNVVRAMPSEMKTGAIGVGIFVAAIGPLMVGLSTTGRAIGNVVSALISIPSAVSRAGLRVSAFAMEMSANAGRVTKAATAVNGIGRALTAVGSAGGMLAIAGVSIAIKLIADACIQAKERADTFAKATDGLRAAAQRAGDVVKNATPSLGEFGGAALGSAKSVDELAKAQAELTDKMNERAESAETEIGQLMAAKQIIDTYTNKDLSDNVTAQGELIAAIDIVNNALGTHYQVLDAAKGALGDESGALLQTVEDINTYILAKERQIRMDQLAADYADQTTKLDEATAAYVNAERAVRDYNIALANGEKDFNQAEYDGLIARRDAARELTEAAQDARNATADAIVGMSEAAEKGTSSIDALAHGSSTLQSIFGENTTSFQAFRSQLEECGLTTRDFNEITARQWGEIVAKWDGSTASLVASLQGAGVSIRELAEQYSLELSDFGVSFSTMVEHSGKDAHTLAQMLHDAGISAQELAQIGVEGFDNLLAAAGGDLGELAGIMDAFNHFQLDPKSVVFTDEGMIDTLTGRLYQFDKEAGKLTATPRYFHFEEDGSLTEIEREVDEVDGSEATVGVNVDDADAFDELGDLYDYVDEGEDGEVVLTVDDQARKPTEETYEYARKGAQGTVTIGVNDHASGVISAVKGAMRLLDGMSATVNVFASKMGFATGAVFPDQTIRAIPRHASGAYYSRIIRALPRNASGGINGIVTRPTLTNIGWVGEAGAEALLHMRNAGGAVVPLSNRRYVRPFARAVASEMGGGSQSVTYNVTVNGASADSPEQFARRFTREVARQQRTRRQ